MQWRRKKSDSIAIGALYQQGRENHAVGRAEVLSVGPDCVGIPHVRYRLHYGYGDQGTGTVETRTLALTAFTQLYPERVPA